MNLLTFFFNYINVSKPEIKYFKKEEKKKEQAQIFKLELYSRTIKLVCLIKLL